MDEFLEYLEIGIVEHCNLNCKGCSHFSPLADKNDYVIFDEYQKDLIRMQELLPRIYKIRLLGGEPLLHPELDKIVDITRQYYPYSDIHIVTNGLLLLSKGFAYQIWKQNNIHLDISLYPPTLLVKDKIKILLDEYNVSYSFTEPIVEFRKRMDLAGSSDINDAYKNCVVGNNCKYLYRGKLSGCPAPNVVRHFEETFNYQLSYETDLIDIHSTVLTGFEIIEKLNKPMQMCKYCTIPENFQWESGMKHCCENDWLVTKR